MPYFTSDDISYHYDSQQYTYRRQDKEQQIEIAVQCPDVEEQIAYRMSEKFDQNSGHSRQKSRRDSQKYHELSVG